jgi:hypothetical protein
MSNDVNPFDNPDAYRLMTVGGLATPGALVEIDGANRGFKWDVQQGVSTSKATSVYKGELLTEGIKTTHHLTEPDHFRAMRAMRKLVVPLKSKKPDAFDVKNAIFNDNEISSITIKQWGEEKHAGGGLWVLVLEWDENSPSTPTATGAAAASKAYVNASPHGASANDEADKQIEDLTKEAGKA